MKEVLPLLICTFLGVDACLPRLMLYHNRRLAQKTQRQNNYNQHFPRSGFGYRALKLPPVNDNETNPNMDAVQALEDSLEMLVESQNGTCSPGFLEQEGWRFLVYVWLWKTFVDVVFSKCEPIVNECLESNPCEHWCSMDLTTGERVCSCDMGYDLMTEGPM